MSVILFDPKKTQLHLSTMIHYQPLYRGYGKQAVIEFYWSRSYDERERESILGKHVSI